MPKYVYSSVQEPQACIPDGAIFQELVSDLTASLVDAAQGDRAIFRFVRNSTAFHPFTGIPSYPGDFLLSIFVYFRLVRQTIPADTKGSSDKTGKR